MEEKAPRLSSATLVAGALLVAFAVINGLSNLAFTNGWSIEEFMSLALAGVLFIVSFFASRERFVPELPNHPSVQEQYEAFDSTPTPYSSTTSPSQPVHQQAATAQPSELNSLAALQVTASLMTAAATPYSTTTPSPQPAGNQATAAQPSEESSLAALQVTAALMAAAGSPAPVPVPTPAPAPSTESIASALASLTSGTHGAAAAEQAAKHPPPHVHTEQGRQFTQSIGSLASSHTRAPLSNIPLPPAGSVNQRQESRDLNPLPSMPDLSDLLPPSGPGPQPTVASSPALPNIPSIDDLLLAPAVQAPMKATTPDLPDLDDLF